jgi:hypothetical protein
MEDAVSEAIKVQRIEKATLNGSQHHRLPFKPNLRGCDDQAFKQKGTVPM